MKISVVVAAYNEEKLIGPCLESVFDQTLPRTEYEVIVVDNNSKDKTAQIAKKLGATVIPYSEHQSGVWAKDFGVRKVHTDLVAMTDADTIVSRDWLENILKVIEDTPLMCVGGPVFSSGTEKFGVQVLRFFNLVALGIARFGVPLIWGPNIAFRKKAFEEVGGFNTALPTGDDWEFILRIQKKYGIGSARYCSKIWVKSSPRKQDKLEQLVPYVIIGIFNFVSLFIFRKSFTFGRQTNVR